MDPQLLERFASTVTYRKRTSTNGRGVASYDTAVELSCYLVDKVVAIRNIDGEAVVSTQQIILGQKYLDMTVQDEFSIDQSTKKAIKISKTRDISSDPNGTTVVYI